MKKSTANFHYTKGKYGPANYIAIIDFGGPFESVEDDIDNIIKDICRWEAINPKDYLFIYEDSEGTWDGYDPTKEEFVHLGDRDVVEAAKHYYGLLNFSQEVDNEIYERQNDGA